MTCYYLNYLMVILLTHICVTRYQWVKPLCCIHMLVTHAYDWPLLWSDNALSFARWRYPPFSEIQNTITVWLYTMAKFHHWRVYYPVTMWFQRNLLSAHVCFIHRLSERFNGFQQTNSSLSIVRHYWPWTNCGLVTPYGDEHRSQHWPR